MDRLPVDPPAAGGPHAAGAPITLVAHDPRWPAFFEGEAVRIRAALRDAALLVEHVGSTSVPGLVAKPRIDILLAVASSADEATYLPALEAAGYELTLREPDWHEHRLLRTSRLDINLHVLTAGSPEIDRMLLMRDRLRESPADRDLYARTKLELAARHWNTVQDYADAKSEVVEDILARATAERAGPERAGGA
jgi:GrpB-like predicted nucleotidyltransferase (UPF0157 family)